jgi:hypothetical protein
MEKITRSNITAHLLDYQLNIIGKTKIILIDEENWRFSNTLTKEQFIEFRKYALPLLQKTFRFNKRKAEDTFKWFMDTFGLRIKG